jgi:curved DNA-binding protein CbpA
MKPGHEERRGKISDMTDKRRFTRYKKDSGFLLEYKGEIIEAKMIDYSVEGIGLEVECLPRIKKGEKVKLVVKSPEIQTVGEIVWLHEEESRCKVGIRNVGRMQGCIEDFHFADTLYGLKVSGKTGVLSIALGNILKKIYLKDGDVIYSTSNLEREHLGEILVRKRKITRKQFEDIILEVNMTNQRLGRVLVSHKLLTPRDVWKAVRGQIEEIVLSLFLLEEGVFTFEDMSASPKEEMITLKLSLANLIYSGTKKITNMYRFKKVLNDLDTTVCFSSDPLDLFQNLRLDRPGQKIISCLANRTSLRDIIRLTGLNRDEVIRTVYALLNTRIIEIRDTDTTPAEELPKEEIKKMFTAKTDPKIVTMIEDMYKNHEKLGYYAALGVTEDVVPEEIKKAYYHAAKKFHPDIHYLLEDDSLKEKLRHIFTYISKAYTVLSDNDERKKYDRTMRLKPSRLVSKQDKARERFREGVSLYRKARYADAEMVFRQALYIDNFRAEYHYYYGLTLLKQSKYGEAKKSIEQAIKLDPINADYVADLGNVYLKMQSPTRAKALFKKAMQMSGSKTAKEK